MIKTYSRIEKETKGAYRYSEITEEGRDKPMAEGAAIGTLYIRKAALPNGEPKVLAVVIDEIELGGS